MTHRFIFINYSFFGFSLYVLYDCMDISPTYSFKVIGIRYLWCVCALFNLKLNYMLSKNQSKFHQSFFFLVQVYFTPAEAALLLLK